MNVNPYRESLSTFEKIYYMINYANEDDITCEGIYECLKF